MIDDPNIRIQDIRLAGYCAKGAYRWFNEHGLDFRKFLKDGIPASELVAKGDALAQRVVEKRKERDNG